MSTKWAFLASIALLATAGASAQSAEKTVASEAGPTGEGHVTVDVGRGGFEGVGVGGHAGNIGGDVHVGTDGSVGARGEVRGRDSSVSGGVTHEANGDTAVDAHLEVKF